MASLTVRQLDEKLKQQLRLRAARNGRSVEDEVRTILRSAAAEGASAPIAGPVTAAQSANGPAAQPAAEATTRRVLLIIGGGIDLGVIGLYVAQPVSEGGLKPQFFVRLRHRF